LKFFEGKFYIQVSELLQYGISEGVIKESMNRARKGSGSWFNIPDPKDARKKLIQFDTIPSTTILRYNIPSPESLFAEKQADKISDNQDLRQELIDNLQSKWMFYYDGTDEKFFQDTYNVNYDLSKGNRAKQLAICAAIMRFLHNNKKKADIIQNTGLLSREELLNGVCHLLNKLNLYGLPSSYDRLRTKYYEWSKACENHELDPRTCLVSAKYGNDHAQKFDEKHMAVLKEVYLRPHKPDIHKSWIDYSKLVTNEYGNVPVKLSRFKQICNSSEVRTLAGKCRDGSSYYEVYVRPFHLRKNPEYSLSLVAGDGWMPGHSVKVMRDGKMISKGLTVWYWMDWKSEAILSWAIRMNEDSHGVRQSFRDIMSLYNVCPASVIIDKKWQEQSDTKRMFEKAGVFLQSKRAYNPKSTKIERNNKEVNKLHRQLDEYWVNMTPGRSMNNRHNDEHLRGGEAMEYTEFESMITTIFNTHNNTPLEKLKGKTRLEAMQESIYPKCKTYNHLEVTWMFGVRHPKPVTVRNFRIQFDIATKRYEYIIPSDKMIDFTKSNVKGHRVKIYYDERFMDTVDIYSFNDESDDTADRYICTCTNANDIKYSAAQVEMTERDWINFHNQQNRGKIIDKYISENLAEKDQILEDSQFDRASVMIVSQENYKKAESTEMALMYKNYYSDQEQEPATKVPVKKASKTSLSEERAKFNKYKNKGFSE
jgi:hypothetical protein